MILHRVPQSLAIFVALLVESAATAGELPTFVGPAMGTTYRVTLAAPISGLSTGEVHREIEAVVARIDRAASTWRDDSDASRFNRAAAGAWLDVADDLVAIVELARDVHRESQGAFDVTAAPRADRGGAGAVNKELPRGSIPPAATIPRACMQCIETRAAADGRPAAIRKTRDGVTIDLGGIGPGYGVDRIGTRLVALGSPAHLVELGGEVRGWGRPTAGAAWRVLLRPEDGEGAAPRVIQLADGEAIATSTRRAGRSPIDPRTGRPAAGTGRSATVRAGSCARADAWAVSALVLDMAAGPDGTIRAPPAPSTPAAPPAATPGGP